MNKVGVVGAGTMGNGIAQIFAQKGTNVVLVDVVEDLLAKAVARIDKNARRVAKKKEMDEDAYAAEITGKIVTSTELAALADCDLVIEAVSENFEIKKTVLQKIDETIGADAILATNTSSISITLLAALTGRPGKFIGMHFMNPVPVMKLVEIIRGELTDDDTSAQVIAVCEGLGKVPHDQRGGLHPDGGRGGEGSHRRRDEARLRAPHGAAPARRSDRPRCLSLDHGSAASRARRLEVPPLPAA